MKLIVFFLLICFGIKYAQSSLASDDLLSPEMTVIPAEDSTLLKIPKKSWIPCSEYQICTESDRKIWKSKRIMYEYLREAKELSQIGPYVEKDSPLITSIRNRTSLCEDYTIAPFLMNEESDEWPIGCLWMGGRSIGVCGPAPPSGDSSSPSSFLYISPSEWSKKVRQFRTEIGCSKTQIKAANEIGELYVCRERCLDIGLGYYQAMILSLGCVLFLTSLIILD